MVHGRPEPPCSITVTNHDPRVATTAIRINQDGVSMAVAFDCYLVDEITAVGDAKFRDKCQRMFKEKLRTSSIVMVSHSMGTLRDYCDMGAVVRDGELYLYDDIKDAIAEHERIMRN